MATYQQKPREREQRCNSKIGAGRDGSSLLNLYNSRIAIFAQASASANAWWWLVIGQPQASATVCNWWLGSSRPKWRREARQVQ